jgi:hypothetical protein
LEAVCVDRFIVLIVVGYLFFQSRPKRGKKLAVVIDDRNGLAFLEIFEFEEKLSNRLGVLTCSVHCPLSINRGGL